MDEIKLVQKRNIIVFEPNKLEVILIDAVTLPQLQRFDDEENYVIIDPFTKECYVNGEWVKIPYGRIQDDGQLVVISGG
jgi:hypothetical protein